MRLAPSLLVLLASLAVVGVLACPPPSGDLDDDDAVEDDDDFTDDDDNVVDDDSTVVDDDDFTIPPGTGLGGTILYQSATGELPAGPVRAGLALMGEEGLPAEERWTHMVSEEGGLIGDTIYTVYVEGEPPDEDFFPVLEGDAEVAIYFPFSYVDLDASGDYSASDDILGFSDLLHTFIRFEGEDVPDGVQDWGGGYGWNTVLFADLTDEDEELDVDHTPDGTNSAIGPEIRVALLPNTGGTVPLTTDVLLPTGSVISAIHSSALDGDTPTVPDFERYTVPASNYELRAADLIDWQISGSPPAGHISPWGDDEAFQVDAAHYVVLGYYDDGDQELTLGTCDTPLALGAPRFLLWVEPSTLDLPTGFFAWLMGVPMGWTLFDTELNTWRLLISGIELAPFAEVVGDDDDSAAGDDDDSAGPDLGIPEECLPGDDDDSAAP